MDGRTRKHTVPYSANIHFASNPIEAHAKDKFLSGVVNLLG